ncbi:hypothetical protein K402DRAFT_424697 [Aulographum hederae CBS 113979]|uniref:Uncharacterized protein n=1 Tax=Aulographum hederae CBS 113979 TaxID=1176131 RepID=A0A6G1GN66_9PEZI|nr:hypothetical protein K402DRAFT_424697 [Aulographum hederae CBS 113979]
MQSTQVLLKGLTSKIHPQLPLSRRESLQLLASLTTSFQHQLANEFGPIPPKRPPPACRNSSSQEQSPLRMTSQSSAALHIDNLLANPLLAKQPGHLTTDPKAEIHAKLSDNPVMWFEDQFVRGAATQATLKMFVRLLSERYYYTGSRLDTTNLDGGRLALQWFDSIGVSAPQACMELDEHPSPSFTHRLTKILVAEGRLDVLSHWLGMGEESFQDPQARFLWKGAILNTMMVLQIKNEEVEVALKTFLAHVSELGHSRHARAAGLTIVRHFAHHSTSGIPTTLYDDLIASAPVWNKSTNGTKFIKAVLALHHPNGAQTGPGSSLMIHSIDDPLKLRSSKAKYNIFKIQFYIDLANELLAQNKHQEATTVMEVIRVAFAKELSLEVNAKHVGPEENNCPSEDELANVRLLEALSLG